MQERRRYRTKARRKQRSAAQATWQALHRNAARPAAAAEVHRASPQPDSDPPHSSRSGASAASRQSLEEAAAVSPDACHQQALSAGLESSDQGRQAAEPDGQERGAADEDGDIQEDEEASFGSMKPLSFRQAALSYHAVRQPMRSPCVKAMSDSDLIWVCGVLLGGCMRRTSRIW